MDWPRLHSLHCERRGWDYRPAACDVRDATVCYTMEALELPKVDIITCELATMCRKLEIAGVPTASVKFSNCVDHGVDLNVTWDFLTMVPL